jgi:hypothetical protein
MILFAVCAMVAYGEQQANLEVQKYTIRADINPRTQELSATARIDFTPNDNITDATFELNNALTVSKVTDARGQNLPVARNAADFTIKVTFPQALPKAQPTSISVSYEGKLTGDQDSPINGIKFAALQPDCGYLLYPARWFPISGYTVNRFLADLYITVPAGYKVIASGDMTTDQGTRYG